MLETSQQQSGKAGGNAELTVKVQFSEQNTGGGRGRKRVDGGFPQVWYRKCVSSLLTEIEMEIDFHGACASFAGAKMRRLRHSSVHQRRGRRVQGRKVRGDASGASLFVVVTATRSSTRSILRAECATSHSSMPHALMPPKKKLQLPSRAPSVVPLDDQPATAATPVSAETPAATPAMPTPQPDPWTDEQEISLFK